MCLATWHIWWILSLAIEATPQVKLSPIATYTHTCTPELKLGWVIQVTFFSRSSGYDSVYKLSGSDLDSALEHVH